MTSIIIPTVDMVARPQAHGYDGTIDNVLIRLGVTPETPIQDVTAEATPPKVDTSESAEDVRDETGRRYSRSNLSGGAGLDFLHSPNRSSDAALRYWDSKGVDVFGTDRGDIYDARLVHSVEQEEVAATILDIAEVNGDVYYVAGTAIYDSAAVLKVTFGTSGVGINVVSMGNSLYSLDDAEGVKRYDLPSWTPLNASPTLFDRIWPVKNRIVGSIDNILYVAAPAGSEAALLTTSPHDTFTDVVDVGKYVLAFSTMGTIHVLGIDPSDGLTLIPVDESTWIDEVPVMAAASFDTIGVVTAEPTVAGGMVTRFYTASMNDSQVGNVQLVYQVGDRDTTVDLTAQAMITTRDSIYVAIPEESGTEVTLWRYYLPTGGYARSLSVDTGVADTIVGGVNIDDRMWLAVNGDGLWSETDEYVATGYVIGPLADFYTADGKQWVSGELSCAALPVGAGLELSSTNNPVLINTPASEDWGLFIKMYTGETERKAPLYTGMNARYHAAKIVWRSDSSRTYSPRFRSFSFRALPNPTRDIMIRIPLNVSDQIDSPRKRAISVRGRGQAIEDVLRAYEGKQVNIELYRPALQVRGLIEKFESTIETISQRGSVRRIMYALIRGTKLIDTSSGYGVLTTGDNLGMGTLGLVTLGTRKVGT